MKLYLRSLEVADETVARLARRYSCWRSPSPGCLRRGSRRVALGANPRRDPAAAPSLDARQPGARRSGSRRDSDDHAGWRLDPGAGRDSDSAIDTVAAERVGLSLAARNGKPARSCPRRSPEFLGDVQAAIKQLIQDQPKIFVKRRLRGLL